MGTLNPLLTVTERSINPTSYYVRHNNREIGFVTVNPPTHGHGHTIYTPFGIQGCEVKDKEGKVCTDRDSAANAILCQYLEFGVQAALGAGKVLLDLGEYFGSAVVKEILASVTTVFNYRQNPEATQWMLAVDYDCPIHGRGRITTTKLMTEPECEDFRQRFMEAIVAAKLKKVNPIFAEKKPRKPKDEPAAIVAGADVPMHENPPG